jgi:hypothetical protein
MRTSEQLLERKVGVEGVRLVAQKKFSNSAGTHARYPQRSALEDSRLLTTPSPKSSCPNLRRGFSPSISILQLSLA